MLDDAGDQKEHNNQLIWRYGPPERRRSDEKSFCQGKGYRPPYWEAYYYDHSCIQRAKIQDDSQDRPGSKVICAGAWGVASTPGFLRAVLLHPCTSPCPVVKCGQERR